MDRFSIARRAGVFFVTLGLSAASHAAALTFQGTTLIGVNGVQVGSTLYDVTFGDQALVSGDFFTTPADDTAATSLYTTLVDTYLADLHPITSINGCPNGNCTAVIMSSAPYRVTYNYASYLSFVPRANGVPSYSVSPNFAIIPSTNMAANNNETWTHWTVETSPVTPVPEPETYAMLLTGLCLIGVSVKRCKAKQAQ